MIQILEDINAEYMADGLTTELVIESETTDVAGQIQQIQNLMNRGVDAIIVNPGDVEGLLQVVADLRARPEVDPTRIGFLGFSVDGSLALLTCPWTF